MKCNTYHVFFRNLAHELKVQIITELKQKPLSVTELSKKLNVEQSTISHALASLNHCSIVQVKQQGKKRIYSLNKETIVPILQIIDKHKCKYCNIK